MVPGFFPARPAANVRTQYDRARLPSRQPPRPENRRRPRRRLRLSRLQGRHQRAQLHRPQLRPAADARRHRLRPRPWQEGAARTQHLSADRQLAELDAGHRPRCRVRSRCPDPRRPRSYGLRRQNASAVAPAPVGAGLGHQLRGDQLLP